MAYKQQTLGTKNGWKLGTFRSTGSSPPSVALCTFIPSSVHCLNHCREE